MGQADYLKLGDWNAVCFTCGFKFKASMLRKNWQGFYECQSCHTPRQPQDFVRGVADTQSPPWVQPEPTDTFNTDACFPNDQTAYPSKAIPGCVKPAYIHPFYNASIT